MNPRKKFTLMQKAKIGAAIGVVVFIVVLEKKRVDALLLAADSLIQDTAWSSFDEGVKYGLTLEKTIHLVRDGGEYAVNALDKAAS